MAADSLYRVAQDLKRKIESGELAPGKQLPDEEGLRAEYRASRNTVRDAIKWLAIQRLVVTRPGRGTFVAHRPEPFVTTLSDDRDPEAGMAGGEGMAAFAEIEERLEQLKKSRQAGYPDASEEDVRLEAKPRATTPRVEVRDAPGYVADRLRINPGDKVVVRHQQFFLGQTPWSLQTTFYPMELVDRGATDLMQARDIAEGTVKYLADRLNLQQCGSRLRILVRPPNDNEAQFFGLPDDGRVSVISLIRTGYEDKGAGGPFPFRATFTVLPGDRDQFVINSGRVPEELAAPARDQ